MAVLRSPLPVIGVQRPGGTRWRHPAGATGLCLAMLVLLLGSWQGCAALDGDGVRRQKLLGEDVSDRAFVTLRWQKELRQHGIFTYLPEEHAGAASSHMGSRIYIGAGDGRLRALEAITGREIWETDMGAALTSAPLVVEALDLLYVAAADGALHAVSLSTGKRRWKYATQGISYQPAVYSDGVLFFSNERDQVFSVDARTGKWRWSYDRQTPETFTVAGHGAPVIHGDRLLAGFSDGTLVCLGARGGDTQWTRSLTGEEKEYMDVDSTPVVHNGVVYASSFNGGLHAVTLEGGALRWRFPVRGASTVAVAGDQIYFASATQGIHGLDLEGRLLWRQHLEAGTPQAPKVRGRALLLSYSQGGLFVVDRLTGRLAQQFDPGGGISSRSLVTHNSVYVLSNRGQLFALTLR